MGCKHIVQIEKLNFFGSWVCIDFVRIFRLKTSGAAVSYYCPVGPLEKLINSTWRHAPLLLPYELLIRLKVSSVDTNQSISIILCDLCPFDHWMPILVSGNNHVAFSQLLDSGWILLLLNLIILGVTPHLILRLVVHYNLFDATRCVAVHEDSLSRHAHLKYFVSVHSAQD